MKYIIQMENPLYTSCQQEIENVVYNPEGTDDQPTLLKFHSHGNDEQQNEAFEDGPDECHYISACSI